MCCSTFPSSHNRRATQPTVCASADTLVVAAPVAAATTAQLQSASPYAEAVPDANAFAGLGGMNEPVVTKKVIGGAKATPFVDTVSWAQFFGRKITACDWLICTSYYSGCLSVVILMRSNNKCSKTGGFHHRG